MTLGDLVDLVVRTLPHLEPPAAFVVANEMWQGERDYTNREVLYAASKLGVVDPPEPVVTAPPAPEPEMTMDPVEVMKELYRCCPRALPADADGRIHVPRIGRAPKDSPFFQGEAAHEYLDQLPDDIKLLIGRIDLVNSRVTITLYDEANDVDRDVGPLDLTRYDSSAELERAIRVLLSRLQSRVLPADWN